MKPIRLQQFFNIIYGVFVKCWNMLNIILKAQTQDHEKGLQLKAAIKTSQFDFYHNKSAMCAMLMLSYVKGYLNRARRKYEHLALIKHNAIQNMPI